MPVAADQKQNGAPNSKMERIAVENDGLTTFLRQVAILSVLVSYGMLGWTIYLYPPEWNNLLKPHSLPRPVLAESTHRAPPSLPVPAREAPKTTRQQDTVAKTGEVRITELRMYDLAYRPTPDGELFKTANLLVNGYLYTVVEGGTIRVQGNHRLKVVSLEKDKVRILFSGEEEVWRRDGIFWDNIEHGKYDKLRKKVGAGPPTVLKSS
jgi:hypothetical protein